MRDIVRDISKIGAKHAGKSRITQLRAGAEVRDMRDTPDTQVADPIYTEGILGPNVFGWVILRTNFNVSHVSHFLMFYFSL